MYKKLNLVLVFFLVFMSFAGGASASGMDKEWIPYQASDDYGKLMKWRMYASPGVNKVKITQYDFEENPPPILNEQIWNIKPNSYFWVEMTCRGRVGFTFYKEDGSVDHVVSRGETFRLSIHESETSCYKEKTVFPTNGPGGSTGDDGFLGVDDGSGGNGGDNGSGGDGGTGGNGGDNGSGGDGGTGGNGGDNGSGGDGGTGGNGGKSVTIGWNPISSPSKGPPKSYNIYKNGKLIDTVPGSTNKYTDKDVKVGDKNHYEVQPVYEDGSEGDLLDVGNVEITDDSPNETTIPGGPVKDSCNNCQLFNCPGWGEHMDKLEEIKDAIPPPPNWDKVADTFTDSIVPEMIDELDDLLGEAPTPSLPPSELPDLDDGGLSNQTPSMPDLPDIPQFDANDIKNGAPTIPTREDPTGGFDLKDNPMDTLPDAPENPKPGETDPGEWGQNKPKEESNPFPYPEDQGEPDIGDPPTPGDNGAKPPTPGGDPGSAPIPGGDLGTPPSTGGETPPMKDYKPSPGSPDGSGGELNI